MIDFVTYLLIGFGISFGSGIVCILSFPEDCETAEDFLEKESIFFVGAWIALALIALPSAAIISLFVKNE
jgi:hypothetical protein